MKLKKYKKRKISFYLSLGLFIVFLSLCLSWVIIDYMAKKANEIMYPLAESKTRKVVTIIINDACRKEFVSNDLYTLTKDENNEIKMLTYNSFEVTKLINEITENVEQMLKNIENGKMDYYGNNSDIIENGVIAEIPFGLIFGNSLLANIGPKIKIRLNLLGDIKSNIETEVKPYGINNAYVEMRVYLEVTARILLPFVSEKVVISNVIPISMNIVQGNIPEAYISSFK